RRVIDSRVSLYLGLFTFWMVVCTALSIWRGGSFDALVHQWAVSLVVFVTCGAIITLRQHRLVAAAMGASAVCIGLAGYWLGITREERVTLESGTLGNANELSLLVLVGLPFLLVPAFSKTTRMRKAFALAAGPLVLAILFRAGSRSSFLALL